MRTAFVAGALANKCGNGGEAWVRLSWIRGLERLGWHVVFVEQVSTSNCGAGSGAAAPWESSANRDWFDAVVERFGLVGRAAVIVDGGRVHHGLDSGELLRRADEAATTSTTSRSSPGSATASTSTSTPATRSSGTRRAPAARGSRVTTPTTRSA